MEPAGGNPTTSSTKYMEEDRPYWRVRWWYSVVVSISGCDPLDPGSNPGTAILFVLFSFCFAASGFSLSACSVPWDRGALSSCGRPALSITEQNLVAREMTKKRSVAFGGTRTHAHKVDYDLNVAP